MRLSNFGVLCALVGAAQGCETVQDAGKWFETHVGFLQSGSAMQTDVTRSNYV